jgi:signal transduction histidine kinase
MNRQVLGLALVALLAGSNVVVAKDEFGSAKDAEAMVAAAVAHIKKVGPDAAYKDFTDKKAPFVDRDLYVVVYSMDGKPLAHGQNPKMVGKELLDMKDPDGKEFVKERVALAKSKGKFWQDYKFTDPVTKKVLPKQAYCEKLNETAVCVGVYKR